MTQASILMQKAWDAYENGDYQTSRALWETLIAAHKGCEDFDRFRSGYGYVLVALHCYDEARAIYKQLFEKTNSHIYVHQLGMVEREAGQFRAALEHFEHEAHILESTNKVAVAANLYEQSKCHHLLGLLDEAFILAKRCAHYSDACDDLVMKGCCARLKGDLYRETQQPDEALKAYQRSHMWFKRAGDTVGAAEITSLIEVLTQDTYMTDL